MIPFDENGKLVWGNNQRLLKEWKGWKAETVVWNHEAMIVELGNSIKEKPIPIKNVFRKT